MSNFIFQTCVVRAWDLQRPLLFAPAMNTYMWQHPLTAQHIATLKRFGYHEIPCVSKKLACGDTGLVLFFVYMYPHMPMLVTCIHAFLGLDMH